MRIAGKSELQDRLASEYALGTLRGSARARFQRWMREHAVLRRAVQEWEGRLAPLAAAAQPVHPPARVWESIAAHIERAGAQPKPSFWRNLSIVTSAMAAALLLIVVVQDPQSPAPAPVVVQGPANEMSATYLAVLSDPKTQKPMLVVSAGRNSSDLWVKALDSSISVPDKSLELWALPPGQAPKSLGVVTPSEKPLAHKLAAPADQSLADVPALAISLEPKGGSPTGAPTGPVLYSGPCLKYW